MTATSWLAALGMTMMTVTACANRPAPTAGTNPLPADHTGRFTTLQEANPEAKAAPNFDVATISGPGKTSLSAYDGKVRLVNFFATWCSHCRNEAAGLVQLQDALGKKGFQIIGLSLDKDAASAVPGFARQYKVNFPIGAGTIDLFRQYGGGQSIPHSFLVDQSGNIVKDYQGEVSEQELQQDVNALLSSKE